MPMPLGRPGRPAARVGGRTLEVRAAQAYVDALGRWCAPGAELDNWTSSMMPKPALRQRAAPGPQRHREMMLSLALWKAVADRHALLVATWDGGRVGVTERRGWRR